MSEVTEAPKEREKKTETSKERKKETEFESLADLAVEVIEGIGPETTATLKTIGINTIEELRKCNPFTVQSQVKIPLHKLMILRKKAQMLFRLRFDEQILSILGEKGYTIQQAFEKKPRVLKTLTQLEMNRIANFLDTLSQLTIFIDADICRKKSVLILRKAEVEEPQSEGAPAMEREKLEAMLENTEVSLLLERMLEGYIKELTPRWVLASRLGFGYPEAEEIIHPRGEITYPILLELADAGVFNRHFYDKVSRCSSCNFTTLMLRNTCVRCGSRNLIREEMIEHYECAHVDLASRFKTEEGPLICPKCAIELQRLGLDYSKPGVMFVCRDCADITGSPYQRLFCLSCGTIIKKDECIFDDVWSFTLNAEKKPMLIDLLNPKYTIITLLTNKGFKFEVVDVISGKIRGKSEVMHFYDIYSEKDADHRLLIEFFSDENQVELSSVYNLIAKAQDIDATIVVLFAFPTASTEVKKFAQYHNVSILEGENLANILPVFETQLDHILQVKFKGMH